MATHTPCFILSAEQILSRIDELSDVLEQCVNDGASVSFMLLLTAISRGLFGHVLHKVSLVENALFWGLKMRKGPLLGPFSSLLINPKTSLIVQTLPNSWFIPLHGGAG